MTPTQTNQLMKTAFAQWGYIEQTPELAGVWHAHLRYTDPNVAGIALQELLGVAVRPPTIASLKSQIQAVSQRANRARGALPEASTSEPVALGDQTCGSPSVCEWLDWLHGAYTDTEWDALTSRERINVIKSHIRHHADDAGRVVRSVR